LTENDSFSYTSRLSANAPPCQQTVMIATIARARAANERSLRNCSRLACCDCTLTESSFFCPDLLFRRFALNGF